MDPEEFLRKAVNLSAVHKPTQQKYEKKLKYLSRHFSQQLVAFDVNEREGEINRRIKCTLKSSRHDMPGVEAIYNCDQTLILDTESGPHKVRLLIISLIALLP